MSCIKGHAHHRQAGGQAAGHTGNTGSTRTHDEKTEPRRQDGNSQPAASPIPRVVRSTSSSLASAPSCCRRDPFTGGGLSHSLFHPPIQAPVRCYMHTYLRGK